MWNQFSILFFSRLSLDRGGRTTKDYEGPTVAPRVQAALDAAMANIEPDIELDVRALQSNPVVKGTRKPKKNSLNGSNPNSGGGNGSGASGSGNNTKAYPSSRGLVPKWDRWAPDLLDWMSVVAVILFICQCLIYLFASSHFSYQNAFNWLISCSPNLATNIRNYKS